MPFYNALVPGPSARIPVRPSLRTHGIPTSVDCSGRSIRSGASLWTTLEPLKIWDRFQDEFRSLAENWDERELGTVWSSSAYRTNFVTRFLGRLADGLELRLERELWKVDYALSVTCEGINVPVIFIESENNIKDVVGASGEVRKLCCHSAPLKVLLTVGEWDETPGVWKGRSLRRELSAWQEIVRAHGAVWPHRGLFGIVVGEWTNLSSTVGRLRFYVNAIRPDGTLVSPDSDRIIFERQPLMLSSVTSH